MANQYFFDKLVGESWQPVPRTNSEGYPVGCYNAMEAERIAMMLSKAGGTFRATGPLLPDSEVRFTNGQKWKRLDMMALP